MRFVHLEKTVDHEEHIPVEPPKRDVFHEQIAADAELIHVIHVKFQELIHVIKQGWHDKKKRPLLSNRIMMS